MESQYQIAKGIVARKNQDHSVVVMKMDESSIFFKIDGVAAEAWNLLSEKKSCRQIISELAGTHAQFSKQIEVDIPKFVQDLLDKKLIVEAQA